MMKTDLTSRLLDLAEAMALDNYGCGLERLDPDHVAFYTERVTEANIHDLADDMAGAAWDAY